MTHTQTTHTHTHTHHNTTHTHTHQNTTHTHTHTHTHNTHTFKFTDRGRVCRGGERDRQGYEKRQFRNCYQTGESLGWFLKRGRKITALEHLRQVVLNREATIKIKKTFAKCLSMREPLSGSLSWQKIHEKANTL